MSDQMYRDFAISTVPEVKQVEDNGRMRDQLQTTITITDRNTGTAWTKVTKYRVTDTALENIILKNFPESTTAQWLRSERDLVEVSLVADLSADNVAGCMHTAMRKLCESKATSYWWNLIQILPNGVMGTVWEETSKTLKEMPKTALLCDYAEATGKAWEKAFERMYRASVLWDRRHMFHPSDEVEDAKKFEALFEDMTHKQFEAYKQSVFMAQLALDYLDESDFAGMLGFMYETGKVEA